MKKRLTYVSPLQVGKVQAVLGALSALVFVIPMLLLQMLLGSHLHQTVPANAAFHGDPMLMFFGGYSLLFLPIVYAILGYIFGVIGTILYNLVAKWTGGIEFITVEVLPETPSALPPSSSGVLEDPY